MADKGVRVGQRVREYTPEMRAHDDAIMEQGIKMVQDASERPPMLGIEYDRLCTEVANLRDSMIEPDRLGIIVEEPLTMMQEKVKG